MKALVGGIAGSNNGTIEKCVSNGSLSVSKKNGDLYPLYVAVLPGKLKNSAVWEA